MNKIILFTIWPNTIKFTSDSLFQTTDKYKSIKDTELFEHFGKPIFKAYDKRGFLWKIENTSIYSYPCLENDDLADYRKNFISSILKTIAKLDFDSKFDKMFTENKFYFVLHDKDIGFRPTTDYSLTQKENIDHLFKFNPFLKKYSARMKLKLFKVSVIK